MKKMIGKAYRKCVDVIDGVTGQVVGKAAAVTGTGLLMIQSAHAALPTPVTDATTSAMTDGTTLGGIVLGVIVALAAFKWLRKPL